MNTDEDVAARHSQICLIPNSSSTVSLPCLFLFIFIQKSIFKNNYVIIITLKNREMRVHCPVCKKFRSYCYVCVKLKFIDDMSIQCF